jgi:predicted GIY-YIG superfamily endonuclease
VPLEAWSEAESVVGLVEQIMWYIYFLELSNSSIYVGSTNDLKRRILSHENKEVTSTRVYTPVKLKSYIAVETEANARELEKYFKSGSGKAFANKRFWRKNGDSL